MRRSIGPIAVALAATYLSVLPSFSGGLAQPGASIAVFDFFNLSDETAYDSWESLFGRGLRRGLFTHKEIEVIQYPAIHKALADLQIDDYFITPEQIPPIGTKVDADLAVLGSFNVEESVIACSLKVVDGKSGKVLAEDIRFGSKDDSDTFLGDLEKGLEKLLFGESAPTTPSQTDPTAQVPPAPPAAEEAPPEEVTAEESPWTPITQVAPVGAPVGGMVGPATNPPSTEPQPSVSIQGPGAPSDFVNAEDASAQSLTAPVGAESAAPPQPPAGVPLQNVLDDAWKRSTATAPPASSPGTVSPPQWSSTSLPPPGPSVAVPQAPPQTTGDPFAPMTAQPAPPMNAPLQQPQQFPQQPQYRPQPRSPIEAELPPLQPPPRAPNIQSPFQPMNVQPAPPPQQVQQYPYVPPSPQSLAPQEPPRPGPISRFFGWFGRRFGGGDDVPPAPTPGAQGIPQQQGQDPNLWIYDQQSNGAYRSQALKIEEPDANRVLVASLPPQSFGVGTDVAPGEIGNFSPPPPSPPAPSKSETFEPKGLAGWAKTYFDAGNYDLAEDAYKKAVLEDPKNADLHFNLAQTELALGKDDAARKSFERASQIRPTDTETLNRLGALQAKKGDWSQAIDTYTALALANPADPESFNKLGLAFDKAGRPREALRSFRKALAIDPKNAHAAHHASEVFEKLNRPEEAQAYSILAQSLAGPNS